MRYTYNIQRGKIMYLYEVYHEEKGSIIKTESGQWGYSRNGAYIWVGPSLTAIVNDLHDHPDFNELKLRRTGSVYYDTM